MSQVFPVYCEQIDRIEVGPLAPEQQALEVAAPSRIQAHDLSVDHRIVRLDRVRELLTKVRPVLEGMPVAGHDTTSQSAAISLERRQAEGFARAGYLQEKV